jgi:hypothetical protein
MTFDAFVGVDWSGAKGSRHRTIQVAMCEPGDGAPRIVPAPGGAWSRRGVLDWMLDAEHQGRVLAGFDFSFTVPFVDRGAFFPGSRRSLPTARDLWMEVDRVSANGDDFYAGAFVDTQPFAAHFQTPRAIGARFSRRHKVVERACVTQGLGWPETVFHLIGPKQVGLGSLAGMRFLAALRREAPKVCVWPFDPFQAGRSTIVEVFPRVFLAAGGQGVAKVRSTQSLNQVLAGYGTRSATTPGLLDDNVTDALVTAAALRAWADMAALWRPSAMDATVRQTEGWIFGVR